MVPGGYGGTFAAILKVICAGSISLLKQPRGGSALAAAVTYLCRTKLAAPVSRQIS